MYLTFNQGLGLDSDRGSNLVDFPAGYITGQYNTYPDLSCSM